MQQTEKYQFNLVESGDAFSPAPLNDNMEKVEAMAQEMAAAMGSGGQTARIAWGSYTGNGASTKTLTFPFKPLFVALGGGGRTSTACVFMIWGTAVSSYNDFAGNIADLTWGGSGGSWTLTFSYSNKTAHNTSGETYYYVAIGASD